MVFPQIFIPRTRWYNLECLNVPSQLILLVLEQFSLGIIFKISIEMFYFRRTSLKKTTNTSFFGKMFDRLLSSFTLISPISGFLSQWKWQEILLFALLCGTSKGFGGGCIGLDKTFLRCNGDVEIKKFTLIFNLVQDQNSND